MTAKQTTLTKRDQYIMVWTIEEVKERLQEIADERGWTLSFLCHTALSEWLEREENDDVSSED